MLERVISGGQSGADQAGLRAARSACIPTGGWAPKGWLAEVTDVSAEGKIVPVMRPCPWLAEFGLVECPVPGFLARTEVNAQRADATAWFGECTSRGYYATRNAVACLQRPFFVVFAGSSKPSDLVAWLEEHNVRTLNVAGNRASKAPKGFGCRVEQFLIKVFNEVVRKSDRAKESAHATGNQE